MLLYLLLFGVNLAHNPSELVLPRGAVAALVKSARGNYKDYEMLISRNIGIRKFLWSPNRMDIIIFHDSGMMDQDKLYIQSFTPDMDLKFVDVSIIFRRFKKVNNRSCPSTKESIYYSPGYHSMCYFWFGSFFEFLDDYDWMLRLDDDCELFTESRHLIPPTNESIRFGATRWIELDKINFDTVSETKEGVVVRGMKKFVNTFLYTNRINISLPLHTWTAPYTNVMYIHLPWIRANTLIKRFIHAVYESGCIYSNRWGDLPLWGAALMIAREAPSYLMLPYEHYSHKMTVLHNKIVLHEKKRRKRRGKIKDFIDRIIVSINN